ncbi:MAG: WecB/TagA/CpsF family glycosyltransferase [Ginsengibacter sp.]
MGFEKSLWNKARQSCRNGFAAGSIKNYVRTTGVSFFYGGHQETLDEAKVYLENTYPDLKVAGLYSPPFRTLTFSEENKVIEEINKTLPSVVFVILGCPKQEKWMAAMKGRINTVMIGMGGALPVMVGIKKRAPRWMQNSGLEWLFRLSQEPLRLFKRYWQTNNLFVWIFLKEFFKIKILKNFNHKASIDSRDRKRMF